MLRMKHVSPGPIEWLPVHSLSTARERCCAVLEFETDDPVVAQCRD